RERARVTSMLLKQGRGAEPALSSFGGPTGSIPSGTRRVPAEHAAPPFRWRRGCVPDSRGATMKRIVAAGSLITWLCAAWPAGGADKLRVVELWPGKAPDEPRDIGPETVRMSPKLSKKEVEVTEPTRLVTNVSKPTITIYRPAKDKDTGAAILICPGGGYWNLYWELEGEEVAAWLNSQGVTGIILKYRVPRRPDDTKGEPARRPLQDAQRAVSLVRSRATDWGIDPNRIGIVGFSAGGHLALATANGFGNRTYKAADDGAKASCRP